MPPFNPSPTNRPESPSSAISPESRQRAALCYVLGVFSGSWFLLGYRRDPFVRFHALQSIGFSIGILVLLFLVRFLMMNSLVLSLMSTIKLTIVLALLCLYALPFVLLYGWIVLIWRAYSGERIKAPFIGHFIETRLGV